MKRIKAQARPIAMCVVIAVAVSSCSIVNPYVSVDDSKLKSGVTLQQAVTYAVDTRDEYYCAISEHALFNRTIGTMIVGAAAAALALGIIGSSADAITGLGAGGAGLFGIHQVLYSANRPKLYAEGAKAIGCTLAAFAGVRAADTSRLEPTLERLSSEIGELSDALADISPGFPDPEGEIPRAKQVLDAGRVTLTRGREANALVRSAGVRLYDAVEGIRAQVNTALLSNEPDVAQLASGLSKTMPAYAGFITGREVALPAAAEGTHASLKPEVRAVLDSLREKAHRVEDTTRQVESIIAAIGAAPTAAQVEACGVNATESGLNFRVDPATVVVDTSAADPTAVVIASGGKPPYHAQWAGKVPGTGVTLQPVDHDRGSHDQAVITIKATQSAVSDAYQLLVTDEGKGRGTVVVSVRSTGGARSGAGSLGAGAGTIGDPAVTALQKTLIDLGCLAAQREGGKTNADGEMGPVTEAAVKKLMVAVGDRETDYDSSFNVNGQFSVKAAQTYADGAKEAGTKCGAVAPQPAPPT